LKAFLEAAIEIIAVVFLFSLFTKISDEAARILNVFNVLVFYFGYKRGEVQGAVMGTVCGLIQDSFSVGVFGISGISKTLMGYATGFISKRINVTTFSRRFMFMLFMFSGEMIVWIVIYSFVISDKIHTSNGLFFFQPLSTTLVALLLFPLFRKLEKVVSHRSQ
jgi:rod shape-determining protein MreD